MKQKTLKLQTRTRKRKAQSLVEFCLCMPILLMLVAGTADIGFLMWTEMTITEAARSGAIFATSISNSNGDWTTNQDEYLPLVKSYIVSITSGTGLAAGDITITPVAVGSIDSLRIDIDYLHTYMAPISFNGFRAESTANTYPIRRSFTCGFISNIPPAP